MKKSANRTQNLKNGWVGVKRGNAAVHLVAGEFEHGHKFKHKPVDEVFLNAVNAQTGAPVAARINKSGVLQVVGAVKVRVNPTFYAVREEA